MSVRTSIFTLLLVLASLPALAGAEPVPQASDDEEPGKPRPAPPKPVPPADAPPSYAIEIVAVDALPFVAMGLGLTQTDARILPAVFGVYLLGGPVVHLYHRRPGVAGGSLLLRLAVPAAGALAGGKLAYELLDYDDLDAKLPRVYLYGAVGAGCGMLVASILDASLLARYPRQKARTWTPTVGPATAQGGLSLGLAGTW